MDDQSLDIDLGVKPSGNYATPAPDSPAPEKIYPSCYVSDVDLEELPESGTIEVQYRLTRSEKNHKTGKYSYTIEIEKILSACEGGDEESEPADREEELDKMLDDAEQDPSDPAEGSEDDAK